MARYFSYNDLFSFAKSLFIHIGCNETHADIAARSLLAADLRGVDSHGIARLTGYVRLWEVNRLNSHPDIKVVYETPSTAVVDGDGGSGLVVGSYAMQVAIEKATHVGSGWVSVKNSNHFGIAGSTAMMALEHDMIGIAMTNASPLVAPTFSIDRLLGTNPIAVAVPAGIEPPFVSDMATTTAANGKLELLQRKNAAAPLGWIQDAEGNASCNPNELKNGGALLPLGGDREHGSHKGYALGAIVDIFSGVLSGANYGPWVPPFPAYIPMPENMPGQGIGHFFGAMRVDAFRPAMDFKKHMDIWIQTFRNARTIPGEKRVYIPGDIEREIEIERKISGIPLVQSVIDELNILSDKYKIPMPGGTVLHSTN